jgi:all-trans-retinol 13,14-reductase
MKKTGEPYANWKDDGGYDVIVIGSGIGGLAVAAQLAKHAGKRVLVLEQHTKAGGFTHAYARKDWDWDVGVHYIGQVHRENSMIRQLFDDIGDGSLQWEPMGEVYDTVVIGDQRWEYVTGREAWRDRMHLYFPDQTEAIDRYLEMVREAIGGARTFFAEKALPGAAALIAGPWMRRKFLRHADRTLGEVLDEVTYNPTLKAVLAAQFGDHGLPPAKASFVIHAMIFNHYLGGAAYPVGGASTIAASIAPAIEAAGGAIIVNAEVESVMVEDGRAVGVSMADGREIRAPVVISDAGVPNTVFHLLPEGSPGREALHNTLQSTARSASHICLYAGFDASDEELGLGRSNLWVYHSVDQDGDLERYLADPDTPLPLAYISFPSAKDPDFANRHPGKATVEVVSIAPYERFQPWEDTKWMKRGEDYEAIKDELSARLIEVLEREVPQIAGKIAYSELSTPLSTRHFGAYDKGEIYGLEHTPARFRERSLRPKTGLKGFYLTGQDVCTAGVAGALFGAVLCASSILGRNLLGEISRNKSS